MEPASDAERNRRIIAISQLVSSFFDTEEEPDEYEFSVTTDAFVSDDTTDSVQSKILEQ